MTTQQILQGVHDWTNGKIVYDISVAHPDGQGNPTPYIDLAAALGTGGANIPKGLRKGGMSVKFIQGTAQSSDNKYVQYRYMGTAVTGTPNPFLKTANWQGIDDVPTVGSNNLVKSGGIKNYIDSRTVGLEETVVISKISFDAVSSGNCKWVSNKLYAVNGDRLTNGNYLTIRGKVYGNSVITNADTGGGYIVFFDENGDCLTQESIHKQNRDEVTISMPSNAVEIGITTQLSVIATTYVKYIYDVVNSKELENRLDAITNPLKDASLMANTAIKSLSYTYSWKKGWIDANGEIHIEKGYKYIFLDIIKERITLTIKIPKNKYIHFYDNQGDIIFGSSITNVDYTNQIINVPSNAVKIGLTNWSAQQPSPVIDGAAKILSYNEIVNLAQTGTLNPKRFISVYAVGDSTISDNVPNITGESSASIFSKLVNADKYVNLAVPGKRVCDYFVSQMNQVGNDADYVLILMGINDCHNLSGALPVGDIDTIINTPYEDLTEDTMLGMYSKELQTLKARLKNGSIIVVISPLLIRIDTWGNSESTYARTCYTRLITWRAGLKKLIASLGVNNGYYFISGLDCGLTMDNNDIYYYEPWDPEHYINHPNAQGSKIVGHSFFNKVF